MNNDTDPLEVIQNAAYFLGGLLMDPAITWAPHAREAVERKAEELHQFVDSNA